MLEQRSLKLDLAALALLALCAFLGLALATYDSADPPSLLSHPPRTHVENACGRSGALAADLMFQGFGVGAYYVLLSLGVLDLALLARHRITDPVLRMVGWLMSLVGLTTLFAMLSVTFVPGPAVGPGGYLGATCRGLLQMEFKTAGSYILVISTLVGGLLLCTEYLLLRVLAGTLRVPLAVVARRPRRTDAPLGKKTAKRTDLAIRDIKESEDSSLSVRIRGKVAEDTDQTSDEKSDDSDPDNASDDSDGEEEAEESSGPSLARRFANSLRRKKPEEEREEVMQELDAAASRTEEPRDYELPAVDLLMAGEEICFDEHEKEVRRKAKVLEKTFLDFGFKVKVVEIETGPVIAQFEVELEAGLRLSKITGLADDLAIALRVPSVRIVAPIPGKNTVGIEVPNSERHLVRLREVIEESNGRASKMRIPIYLGKDVSGKPLLVDLATLPHLLIAGRTGTGKSVCLNSIIVSMIMTRRPDEVRMLMIDPKMVELSCYKQLPHLMHPVVTDMRKAEAILAWAVEKMEERYALLAQAGVRHISSYNQLGEEELMDRLQPETEEERKNIPTTLPYIVIVADEMADLMMTAAKEVEQHIIRLAQKSRAVGIHLVLATQKPTVDVITGLIKSNLPARIAFQVASRTDSRVVLDEMGADKLLGNGDMLFLWPGTSTLLRGQGTYVSDDEINSVVDFVATTEPQFVKELVALKANVPAAGEAAKPSNRDELYDAAIDIVIREGRGSVSLLQRALGIGYGRAARLIDFMAEDGIVGTYNGSQARDVLITLEQWAAMSAGGELPSTDSGTNETAPHAPARTKRVLDVLPPVSSRKGAIRPNEFEDDRLEDEEDAPFETDDAFDEEEVDGPDELAEDDAFDEVEDAGDDALDSSDEDDAEMDEVLEARDRMARLRRRRKGRFGPGHYGAESA